MSTIPEKPPPARWETIARVADEARAERLELPGDEELTRQLREAGFADDAADRVLARALADDARLRGRATRPWVPLLVAAALVLAVLFAWKRRELVAWWEGQPAPIGPDRPGPERALTAAERAAALRDNALGACGAQQWAACAAGLDAARSLDPAGEAEGRVVAARAAIDAAIDAATARDGGDALKPR